MKDSLINPFDAQHYSNWDRAQREAFAVYLMSIGIPKIAAYTLAFASLTLAAGYLINAFLPKIEVPQGLLTNTRQAAAPQDVIYGEIRKGGIITYMETNGSKNRYLHMMLTLAGHEVDSINEIFLKDQTLKLHSDGFVYKI